MPFHNIPPAQKWRASALLNAGVLEDEEDEEED